MKEAIENKFKQERLKIGSLIETESNKNFKGLLLNKADRDEVEKI